jgi:hypothetical protein
MKHYLWKCALIITAAALSGCGGGGSNSYNPVPSPTSTPAPGPTASGTPTGTTLAIPPAGGSVTSGVGSDGIVANQTFASGQIGATVTIADYGESTPPNAPVPSSKARSLASRSAQASTGPVTVVFHSLTLNFNRPLTGSQYTSQVLTNDVPAFGAPYALTVADSAAPATILFTSTGTLANGALTFPIPANASFVAGHTYVAVASGQEAATLPMTVVNNTGFPGYVFILSGSPIDGSGFYYGNGVGMLVQMNAGDGSTARPNPGWTPTPPQTPIAPAAGSIYFVTSSAWIRPLPASGTIPIPLGRSQRYYFSVTGPIAIQVNYPSAAAGSQFAPSAPWSTPGEVNIDTPFDWIESNFFVSGTGTTFGPNNTSLQMFGLPLSYTVTGPSGVVTAGFMPNGRSQVLAALKADSAYSKLIYVGNNLKVNPVRAISPDNGIFNAVQNRTGLPTYDKTLLQAYLDNAWTYYQTHTLTFNTAGLGTYSGMVNASSALVLTSSLNGQPTVTIPKPGVYAAIVNGGLNTDAGTTNCTASPANNGQCEQLTSMLSAAFNRGMLALNNPPYTDQIYRVAPCPVPYVQSFYTNPTPGWLNLYAKIMHQNSYPTPDAINGGSYGFGFEDNCDQSSLISGNAAISPTSFTVTINPM